MANIDDFVAPDDLTSSLKIFRDIVDEMVSTRKLDRSRAEEIQKYIQALQHKLKACAHYYNILQAFGWDEASLYLMRLPHENLDALFPIAPVDEILARKQREVLRSMRRITYHFSEKADADFVIIEIIRNFISDCVNATDTMACVIDASASLKIDPRGLTIRSIYKHLRAPLKMKETLEDHVWENKKKDTWLSDLRAIRGIFQHGAIEGAFSSDFSSISEPFLNKDHCPSRQFNDFKLKAFSKDLSKRFKSSL